MEGLTWDIHTASEEWLVEFCEGAEKENRQIWGHKDGDRVVKLSHDIAVKFGHGVTHSEAKTQEFAHRNANPSIVHVPRVYRFFQRNDPSWHCPKGYLFMEYVPGESLQELDLNTHTDIVPRIAKIVAHLGQIQDSQIPGPVGGGQPEGYLWGDDGARAAFAGVADMEAWLNKRLSLRNKSINLSSYPLVLCHMDLCRRNMVLEENNTICLLDWGFAGLYPRFFEIASLSCLNPYDEPYEKPLLEAIATLLGLTGEEKHYIDLLQIARAANLRYTLYVSQHTIKCSHLLQNLTISIVKQVRMIIVYQMTFILCLLHPHYQVNSRAHHSYPKAVCEKEVVRRNSTV
jgi:aminoglycoside phosphotransferase